MNQKDQDKLFSLIDDYGDSVESLRTCLDDECDCPLVMNNRAADILSFVDSLIDQENVPEEQEDFWDGKVIGIGDRRYRFVLTCHAYPEQYDVFLGDRQVAYFRLRSNYFSVDCPECHIINMPVYVADTKGYGDFEDEDERRFHMTKALRKVDEWVTLDGTYG